MFTRFNGNVVPFANDSTSTNRTVFGGVTQSDAIDDNLNADFKKGWEIVGLNDNPTREDFNAMGYTNGYLISYLYQAGIPEYNATQNYLVNSIVMASNGNIYKCLIANSGNNPITDKINWTSLQSSFNTGFKNLIINGNKQVNQSGLTTTNNAYNYDNHYKVGNNWFMFVNGKNIVSGKPYTLSWDGAATASYYIGTAGALTINAQTFIPITNGSIITSTITSNQKLWIKFASDASGSTYSKVQLEPGTVPTPFEHRLYELEESLVQRVYEHGIISTLALSSSTTYQGGISNAYFKTTKDIVPQIVITTNNGNKSALIWAINKDVVQFTPTVQASVNDFINVVANIDARPY